MSKALLNVGLGADQDIFINWIKSGQGYGGNITNLNQYACPVTTPPTLELSANAWRMQIDLPPTTFYSGHWVLKFKGTGGFKLTSDGGALTVITSTGTVTGSGSNALSLSGTDPRVEFSVSNTGGAGWFGQFLGGSTTYSNMKGPALVRLSDEAAYDAGEFFNPDFISQLKSINPYGLRLLQYSNTSSFDQNNALPFTHMPGPDYLTWGTGSDSYPISCYVGTIGGTDTYTCSSAPDTPGTITPGETVWGTVTNSNTLTTATLNINGRGAKKLLHHDANTIGVNEVVAGALGTFVYEPTSDGYMYSNAAIQTGVPLNVQVALCNKVGCNLWYNINANMPDNEITTIVQYIRDNLNSNLVAFFEFGNEIWGGVAQPAAIIQTWANLVPTGPAQILGYEIRKVMGLVTTAWSPRGLGTLRRVAAWQAFGAISDWNAITLQGQFFPRMTGLGWDTAPNRPVDFVDVIAYATYYEGPNTPAFQGGYTGNTSGVQAGLYTAADNYDSGNPTLMSSALDWVDNDIRQGTGGNGDPQTLLDLFSRVVTNGQNGIYSGWEAMVATYDASRPTNKLQVINYEGGLQINAPTTGTLTALGINTAYSAKIANLFSAYKNDVRFKRLVLDQFNQFMTKPHSVAPAWYAFCGAKDQWSTHPGDLYSTPYKSYDALVQFDAINTPGPKNIRDNF